MNFRNQRIFVVLELKILGFTRNFIRLEKSQVSMQLLHEVVKKINRIL